MDNYTDYSKGFVNGANYFGEKLLAQLREMMLDANTTEELDAIHSLSGFVKKVIGSNE